MNPVVIQGLQLMLTILSSEKATITDEMKQKAKKITDIILRSMEVDAEQMQKEYSTLIT